MKVLIWACGFEQRFAGPSLAAEAEHQGFECRVTGSRSRPHEMIKVLNEYKPDIVFSFVVRHGFDMWYDAIKNTGAKLVLWYPDMTETRRDRMWRMSLNNVADALIFSALETAQRYCDLAPTVLWMPQYFDHRFCFGPQPAETGVFHTPQRLDPDKKIYDLCFIGSCDRLRDSWLNRLEKRYNCFFSRNGIARRREIRGPAMVEAYAQSKIAFNIQREMFLNPGPFVTSNRIYNAMGSGAFFINHKVEKLDLVFKQRIHCVMHNDTFEDLCDKIDHYLTYDRTREQIAAAGQNNILRYHTLEQRVKEYWQVLEAVHENRAGEIPAGAFGEWVTV